MTLLTASVPNSKALRWKKRLTDIASYILQQAKYKMVKTDQPFEIKVALLGNVSAGKSTVLNALLKDKFSEVAMKRTTAGVNYFSVFKKPSSLTSSESDDSTANNGAADWTNLAEDPKSAEATLKEITQDNRIKLSSLDSTVPEKHFEVELDQNLVEMRSDTKLVLVDIPGLNEAGSFDHYKKFVCDQ